MLRTELHCHNVYSNGHVGDLEPPFDSNVTINEQLEKSFESKLDILFVTNHNTLDGFKQITEYKNNHEKFSNLEIYPAVEITTDKEAHVLVYGLHDEIKPNQSIDEILDAAKSQDAVTIAPHPFSLVDALRNDSLKRSLTNLLTENQCIDGIKIDVNTNLRKHTSVSITVCGHDAERKTAQIDRLLTTMTFDYELKVS